MGLGVAASALVRMVQAEYLSEIQKYLLSSFRNNAPFSIPIRI
jgi:hypothetical protein